MRRVTTALFILATVCLVFIFLSDLGLAPGDTEVWRALCITLVSCSFVTNQIDFSESEDDKKVKEREEAEWMERVSYLKAEDRVWLESVGFDTTGLPTRQEPEKTDGFATGMARAFAKGLLGHRTVR